MSALTRTPIIPQCLSCLRKTAGLELFLPISPFRTQVRGKKKIRLPDTINVRLLQDCYGYGQKGAIVPVAPGRMRNVWHPRRRAEYVTPAELKEMKDVVIERDFTFGVTNPEAEGEKPEKSVQFQLLSPQRTTQLLEALIPGTLHFYRPRISAPEPEQPSTKQTLEKPGNPAPENSVANSEPLPNTSAVAIYGSVSTADIATSIKAFLGANATGKNEDAARIVLGVDEISIIRVEGAEASESDRIKTLGDFVVEILPRGGEAVRRTVRVEAQDEVGEGSAGS